MIPTLVAAHIPLRTKKIGNFTIYLEPRMSANQLAQYLVSEPSKQEAIVRDAKRVGAVRVAIYEPARKAVHDCHDQTGLNHRLLALEAARMETAVFSDAFVSESNRLSAASLKRLLQFPHEIDCKGEKIARPRRGFDQMMIQGVRVSVQPDIVFTAAHRGGASFGGVIMNFSKGEQSSLSKATGGRFKAGDYAAFLVFQMLALRHGNQGGPRLEDCVAIDVYRDQIYSAPSAQKTALKNVQAACRTIALQWSAVSDEDGEPID